MTSTPRPCLSPRVLLVCSLALSLLGGCGGRSLPVQEDGAVRDDARAADAAAPRKKDTGVPGTCVHPEGGCYSPDDCPAGWSCEGCGPDPCCPMCAVCYGTCAPPTADCPNTSCRVVDDCCTCAAVDDKTVFERCDEDCEQPTCAAIGILDPLAYCVADRCLLAEAGVACGGDADCVLLSDCCGCAAYPAALAKQRAASCLADCLQPACDGLGLQGAMARCVSGVCRIVLPSI